MASNTPLSPTEELGLCTTPECLPIDVLELSKVPPLLAERALRQHPVLGTHLHAPLSQQSCHALVSGVSGSASHGRSASGPSTARSGTEHTLRHLRHHPHVGTMRHSPASSFPARGSTCRDQPPSLLPQHLAQGQQHHKHSPVSASASPASSPERQGDQFSKRKVSRRVLSRGGAMASTLKRRARQSAALQPSLATANAVQAPQPACKPILVNAYRETVMISQSLAALGTRGQAICPRAQP